MKYYKNIFLLFFITLMTIRPAFAVSVITEELVQNTIDELMQVIEAKDVEKLMSYYSDDAIIEIILPEDKGGKIIVMASEYKQVLERGWAHGEYEYELKDVNITIDKNKKRATVTDTVIANVKLNGQSITSTSYETMVFEIIKGKLKIVSLTAEAVM